MTSNLDTPVQAGATLRSSSPLVCHSTPEGHLRRASVASVSSFGSARQRSGELPMRSSLAQRFVRFWKVRHTTGESSRDFLARERTFFSWLRLSTLLAIVAGALFLRLRLQPTSSASQNGTRALRLKRRRRVAHARRSQQSAAATSPAVVATLLASTPFARSSTLSSIGNRVYDSPILANGLGALFLILALAALTAGWIDYLTIERALEEADRKVENEAQGEATEVCHDLKAAGGAHSSRAVFALEVVISISVGATAVLLLVSDGASGSGSTVYPGPARRAWYLL